MVIKAKEIFTTSNLLSFARFFLAIPILYFLHKNTGYGNVMALVFILLAVVTDFLDGYFARRLDQVTDLGKIIDPLSDKIAIAAVVLFMTIWRGIPIWFLVIVFARDLVILTCGLYTAKTRGIVMHSNISGKMTVTGITLTLAAYVLNLHPYTLLFLWGSVCFMIISSTEYFIDFYHVLRSTPL